MKEDLPYFSHDNDSRNHPKMKALRARFGWTGYGQFWALNEMIAGAAYARLDISRPVIRSSVACEIGMTPEALDSFLEFLANHDECGLINYAEGIITTDRTQENYAHIESDRLRKRDKGKNGAEKRHSGAEKVENGAEEVSKLNETKGNKTKVKESKRVNEFIPPTFEEITAYVKEKRYTVDPRRFLDYYEASNWIKKNGEPVLNWKQTIGNWKGSDTIKPTETCKPFIEQPWQRLSRELNEAETDEDRQRCQTAIENYLATADD